MFRGEIQIKFEIVISAKCHICEDVTLKLKSIYKINSYFKVNLEIKQSLKQMQ